jgi:hypothetical protein
VSKNKQIFFILTSLFLITLSWGILTFVKTLLSEKQNNNLNYLPENINFAVRINGKELAKKTLFSVFIESKDEEVFEKIRTFFKQQTYKKNEFRNAGIDFLSDILFFRTSVQNRQVSGLIFNVSNTGLFKKSFEYSSKCFACKGDVGVILFDDATHPIGKEKLTLYAKQMLRKKSNVSSSANFLLHPSKSCFEVLSREEQSDKKSPFKETAIHFNLNDKNIYVLGNLLLNKEQWSNTTYLTKSLKPDGFHLSGTHIPTLFSDTINFWLKQFDCKLPYIKSVSLNFRGTKIINHSSGFFVVPQMDLMAETSRPVDIERILENEKLKSFLQYQKDSNYIRFQEERLYFKQLSETSFYIGRSVTPMFTTNSSNALLTIKGDIRSILKVEGNHLISSILEMIPEYRASNQLTEHVDKFDLTVRRSHGGHAQLKGEIRFKQTYYSINEIIKFLIIGEFFG